jgi:hypothetical protein
MSAAERTGVASGAARFYEELLLGRHLESTREGLRAATEKYQVRWDGRPCCTALRPYLIERAACDRAFRAVELLGRGLRAAAERLLVDEPLRRRIGLPEYLEPILELDRDRGGSFTFGRMDGYLDGDELMCFEFNVLSGTLTMSQEVTTAFESMPIARDFRSRFPFRTVSYYDLAFEAVREADLRRGGDGFPTVCTLRSSPEICPHPRSLRWIPYLAARGLRILSANEDELAFSDGRLFAQDLPVDVLLFATLEEAYDLLETTPGVAEAIRTGAVRTFDGLSRGLLCNHKGTFEVLSDPACEDTFEPEVRAALHRHIPWTRILGERRTPRDGEEVDLLPFVEANRASLVIKPCGASSGTGVVLGWCVDEPAWRRAIEEGVSRHHVVQGRVPGRRESFPLLEGDRVVFRDCHCDFDTHLWNDRAEGNLVRLSRQPVTNIGEGGSMVPIWILD